ncbi:MAG: EscU/YscU/HrcU family type III secretion system export apparatus switch protein [Acidobacteria bacterium]|nr:EscU/YscU/HrcU family type III secretion system export apparatus switch protein [Acidobacteriota bacterium]
MADPQRTEQPTPRRLEKARKDGQYPVSKEFVSALVFLAFVWLLGNRAPIVLDGAREMMRDLLTLAFRYELTVPTVSRWVVVWSWRYFAYFFLAGLLLTAGVVGIQMVKTGFGLAPAKLMPDPARLNPLSRLSQMPWQNLTSLVQAVVLLPVFAWILYALVTLHWNDFLLLPRMSVEAGIVRVASILSALLWKAAVVLVVLGSIDLFRQRRRWMNQLRMTKQEVREEQKDIEGNPLIRMRIRRLQREALRRRMMEQVPKATAVIVNPTHFAVAIRYQPSLMAAPKVVAKGKNHLALRIRDLAVRSQVPVIENPPLAQSLFRSAEVGQEIPAHLYQAVAEVLAYIYRLTRGHLPGQ